jgi:hypothetical protein
VGYHFTMEGAEIRAESISRSPIFIYESAKTIGIQLPVAQSDKAPAF